MFLQKSTKGIRFVLISLLLLFVSTQSTIGQEANPTQSSEELIAQAYNDVWQPFMESYRELNIAKFKSIQAKDLTRVSIDRNSIQTKAAYFGEIEGFFNQFIKANRQLDVRFAILTSAAGNDRVYQTGYYSVGYRASESEAFKPMGYGYFTVVLIKEDGVFKIAVDADKQAKITEEEFKDAGVIYQMD
ncbi:MAG: hypothetical protein ABJM06_12815 [Gilvibacter sp.]